MLFAIPVVAAALVAGLLFSASRRPDEFRVERSAEMRASADKIFPHIADLHRWSAWSPWEKLDPSMKRTFGGAESGKGAIYEWDGNKKAGQGRMEIIEATPSSRVAIDLHFIKPFEAKNVAQFVLEPRGEATRVTWSITGHTPFAMKVMHTFINMDKLVGKDFEAGLANLKGLVEK